MLTTDEAGMLSASDSEQLAFAREDERVVVTFDHDYLALHASEVPHAGIVFAKMHARSIKQMVEFLKLLHEVSAADEMVGRIEFA